MDKLLTKVVLFFLHDGNDSEETRAAARALRFGPDNENRVIRFRNGSVDVTGAPEMCDYVAGDPIPVEYLARFPVLNGDGTVTAPANPPVFLSPDPTTPPNAGTPESEEEKALREEVGNSFDNPANGNGGNPSPTPAPQQPVPVPAATSGWGTAS